MIKTITYRNAAGDSIVFPAGFSAASPFVLQDASGVLEAKADTFTTGGALSDGVTWQGSRLKERNIVLTVRDNPRSDHATNRARLFTVFKFKEEGVVTVSNENGVVRSIGAVVESVTPDLKSRSNSYQISLLCPNPYWTDADTQEADVSSWEDGWEWPITAQDDSGLFEIVSDTPEEDVFEFGSRTESVIADIVNTGDVTCGIVVLFSALGIASNPGILNPDTGEFLRVNLTMTAGDTLEIDTRYGHRTAVLSSGGVKTNVFRLVDPDSVFLQLKPGDNHVKAQSGAGDTSDLDITIFWDNQYLSV